MCNTGKFEIYKNAAQIRREIQNGEAQAAKAREKLEELIRNKAKQGTGRLQPKTPDEAPDCLYYFEDIDNVGYVRQEKDLNQCVDIRGLKAFEMMSVAEQGMDAGMEAIELDMSTSWTEDYLHIYQDGKVGTGLPFYRGEAAVEVIMQGQRARLEADYPDLYRALTTSHANMMNVYMPKEHPDHFFLRSMIDGGNMLTGKDFAVIGKDALHVTCVQNGIREDEARLLMAQETGYDAENLYFVEQPGTYHLDLNMMLLGKGTGGRERIWVGGDFKGVCLDLIYEELREYGFEVIVDRDQTAASAEGVVPGRRGDQGRTIWNYNFFNGEFVYGKNDHKLYYVTNGTFCGSAKQKFEERLKAYVPKLERVIFCQAMTAAVLNETHGGVGCRFKGGPAGKTGGVLPERIPG